MKQSTTHQQSVPRTLFKTDGLPSSERFAAWRDGVSPLFDCAPAAEPERHAFKARLESFNLDSMFFAMSEFSAQRFQRDTCHPAAEDADHLLVQLYMRGGYEGHNGGKQLQVGPGDVSILDLGQPLATRARASKNLSLIIPRDLFHSFVGPQRLAWGSVLSARSAMGKILSNHLLTIWQNMHSASVEELEAINRMLMGAVAGAFGNSRAQEAQGAVMERATLKAIQSYIRANLSAELTPSWLCKHFGCSRASLYRLFDPVGGVASYVRECRLARCRDEFYRLGKDARVLEIALTWGFSSHSHFCRLFKRAYGMSPSDAISHAEAMPHRERTASATRSEMPEFHHWLKEL